MVQPSNRPHGIGEASCAYIYPRMRGVHASTHAPAPCGLLDGCQVCAYTMPVKGGISRLFILILILIVSCPVSRHLYLYPYHVVSAHRTSSGFLVMKKDWLL